MNYLPIFLKLKGRPCLVVGGGKVAVRKVLLLRRAGAAVSVVAPSLCEGMAALQAEGSIVHLHREFQDEDINDKVLVIAATDDEEVNRRVSVGANRHRIPVNVVDSPHLCSFIMPSIIDRWRIPRTGTVVTLTSGEFYPFCLWSSCQAGRGIPAEGQGQIYKS
jgi:uroporphyrin-III C-methyltransferase/precorrin-2 dehydrogenase/sirohydrochlorin ferrochelatase